MGSKSGGVTGSAMLRKYAVRRIQRFLSPKTHLSTQLLANSDSPPRKTGRSAEGPPEDLEGWHGSRSPSHVASIVQSIIDALSRDNKRETASPYPSDRIPKSEQHRGREGPSQFRRSQKRSV